jgi:hypothetical protein
MGGSRSRGARSGGKTAPKKTKRAKSEFQGRKRHFAVTTQVSKEEIRNRVVESLSHMGHQVLSKEPGGYNLNSWLKSLRLLLDDFESKVGADALSEEYREKRRQIEEEFSQPAQTGRIEADIEALRKEEMEIKMRLKYEGERIAARLSAIGGEKTGRGFDLEEEKANLQRVMDERRSTSFFSKLVGRSGPPLEPAQKRVEDIQKTLLRLEEETLNLQTLRRSIDGGKTAVAGAYDDMWDRIAALGVKLTELNDLRDAKLQIQHEREEATEALRKVIMELKLKEEGQGEEEARSEPATG